MKRVADSSFTEPYKFCCHGAGAWNHSEWTAGASSWEAPANAGEPQDQQLPLVLQTQMDIDDNVQAEPAGDGDRQHVHAEAEGDANMADLAAEPEHEVEEAAEAPPAWETPMGQRWSKRWRQLPNGSFSCRWILVRAL